MNKPIVFTKTTAARNAVALSYHSVCGLYFLAVVFAATIVSIILYLNDCYIPEDDKELKNLQVFWILFKAYAFITF